MHLCNHAQGNCEGCVLSFNPASIFISNEITWWLSSISWQKLACRWLFSRKSFTITHPSPRHQIVLCTKLFNSYRKCVPQVKSHYTHNARIYKPQVVFLSLVLPLMVDQQVASRSFHTLHWRPAKLYAATTLLLLFVCFLTSQVSLGRKVPWRELFDVSMKCSRLPSFPKRGPDCFNRALCS
jgi:hypothetical protein